MTLTTAQRVYLRSLAQDLRPQLHVGHQGYTPGVQSSLEDLFRGRELVKVRVLATTEEGPREIAQAMSQAAEAELVGVVGKTFVLYRPNVDLKHRIELPGAPSAARPRPARRPYRSP